MKQIPQHILDEALERVMKREVARLEGINQKLKADIKELDQIEDEIRNARRNS